MRDARGADRFTQFALVAAQEAVEQAGWAPDGLPYDPGRIGCVIGTSIGGFGTLEASHIALPDRGERNVAGFGPKTGIIECRAPTAGRTVCAVGATARAGASPRSRGRTPAGLQ